jgi:uncharacterized protein (DUF2062 family)
MMSQGQALEPDTPNIAAMRRLWSPHWWWREFLRQLKELRGKPHEIALGMAIGVFIGITPTIPLHTILAVSLALLVRGSKLAAGLGVWVSNPLSIPIFYYGSYRIGQLVLGLPDISLPDDRSLLAMARLGGEIVGAMLLGGMILGIIPAIVAYVLTLKLARSQRFRGATESHRR